MCADFAVGWKKRRIFVRPGAFRRAAESGACRAFVGHLYGSRATLARLTSDTCVAHEQHLHGSRRIYAECYQVDYQ
ncbi:hypothetical protein [uncultured Bacteroides sp.]|uniref:hypothetical protein n=1 Tax=uncultured Bacteroides sp. TaxID=162156 RepID=UPI00259A395E|nr:hypothetical protein [uncultured Bacteroides sp.]